MLVAKIVIQTLRNQRMSIKKKITIYNRQCDQKLEFGKIKKKFTLGIFIVCFNVFGVMEAWERITFIAMHDSVY